MQCFPLLRVLENCQVSFSQSHITELAFACVAENLLLAMRVGVSVLTT